MISLLLFGIVRLEKKHKDIMSINLLYIKSNFLLIQLSWDRVQMIRKLNYLMLDQKRLSNIMMPMQIQCWI